MRRPRGAVNLVNFTLTVAVVSGAYLGWLWIPLWLDDLDVREVLAAAVSQLTAEAGGLEAPAIQKMVAGRLATVGYHWDDSDGARVQVPGLGLGPEEVQVEKSKDGRSGKVEVDYTRTVKLKPLDRYWNVPFHTAREAKLIP